MIEGRAHERLVGRALGQVDVPRRLTEFPALADAYADVDFEKYRSVPPYYCHYLAWRLARFRTPLLSRLDELFSLGASLPGWKRERRSLVHNGDFSVFWSFVWQLQVAEFLSNRGVDARWMSDGPDLQGVVGAKRFYVECLTLRKSHGVRLFIEELLQSIHDRLKVDHPPFLKFNTPQQRDELDRFLDELFQPFLDPAFLPEQLARADETYPVLIDVPEAPQNLTVSVDGGPDADYVPLVIPQGGGDQTNYLNAMLREAVSNKADANQLSTHRPNVLAVNLLLARDPELAISLGAEGEASMVESIDELVFGAVGIDQQLAAGDLRRITRGHPVAVGWQPGELADGDCI